MKQWLDFNVGVLAWKCESWSNYRNRHNSFQKVFIQYDISIYKSSFVCQYYELIYQVGLLYKVWSGYHKIETKPSRRLLVFLAAICKYWYDFHIYKLANLF